MEQTKMAVDFLEVASSKETLCVRAWRWKAIDVSGKMGRKSRRGGGGRSRGEANAREAGTLLRPEWRCRGGYGRFTISILLH